MRKLILLLLISLISCDRTPPKPVKKPPLVTVAKAEAKPMPYVVRTIGNTIPYATVNITPQVSGELTGYYFADGQDVKEGDLLFTIDPRTYQAELEQAQGQLLQAQGSLQFNQQRLKRYHELLPDDFVSKLNYEEYLSGAQQATGQVKEFEGNVNQAKVNLGYCQITSPLEGRCGRRLIDPGNVLSANQQDALLVINQITPLYALFNVPERDFLQIQKYNTDQGLKVSVQVPGEKEIDDGYLDFVDNTVDSQTGTLQLRAVFPNKEKTLWPGQFVNVTVTLFEIPDAVLVPETAVGIDTTGSFVWIAKEDDTAEKRSVKVGQQFGRQVVINEGVKSGDTVITGGQSALAPGMHFRVKEAE